MRKDRVLGPGRQAFASADHDHGICVAAALAAATRLCQRRGARLTQLRQRILEQVWRSHAPQGAYAILSTLNAEGRRATPPTVYRALEFLLEHGLIHRIESLNAFVGCATPGEPHAGHFLICSSCGVSAEVDDRGIDAAVRDSVVDAGFKLERQTIELTGLCPACQGAPTDTPDAG